MMCHINKELHHELAVPDAYIYVYVYMWITSGPIKFENRSKCEKAVTQ